MASGTESRKQFLKRFGFNLIGEKEKNNDVKIVKLSNEQALFLEEYTVWLEEFHKFIKMRNSEPFSIENNKRLMEISAEAEKRRPDLEEHMEDILFSTAFKKITEEISGEIDSV